MDLDLVRVFIKIVKTGSYSKASEILKIPKSTLSKNIARLEQETGTKLLVRTTRSQTLTAAGKAFFDTCVGPLQVIEDAQKSLIGNDSIIAGTIKMTATEDLGTYVIAPALAELTQKHPQLQFEIIYTEKVVDLIKEGFDLAIRIGPPVSSSLKMKNLGSVRSCLVASPGYLNRHPKIQQPEDLSQHQCLSLGNFMKNSKWTLQSKNVQKSVLVKPCILSNQMSSLMKAALSDGGIALIPQFLCQAHLTSGALQLVLPQWQTVGVAVSILSPLPFSASARLRVTTDHLVKVLQQALGSSK